MNRSKKGPVAPSARNQLVAGAVTPADPCPAANVCPSRVMYIARSTMIGCGAVTTAETSVEASSGPWVSTGIVVREFGGSAYRRSMGGWPNGRR